MSRPQPAEPSPDVLAQALADQRERWQRGERALVEEYLAREPRLRGDREALLDLVYHEIVLREEHGESVALAEYVERFPDCAEQLALHFEVHRALAWDPAPEDEEPPPAISGYELLGKLGQGGMGVVYRAHHLKLNRVVALKRIRAGELASRAEASRFLREAQAVARLQHANIVQIYEVGEHEGSPYFSLELVDGGSLALRLAGKPQPAAETARLIETLARAVQHAHDRGVVHRDLKPANVLMTADGIPKIADFGLAKRIDVELEKTQTGALLGTPSHMAPEQAAGRAGEIGPTTDVHALGTILYEMLTGRPPHRGTTVLETLEQVRSHETVAPSRLQPRIPRDLDTICLKCLEKEPRKRYASAAALADDLHRFLAGEPIQARPMSALEHGVRWARRRPALASTLLVCGVSVILLLVTLAISNVLIGRQKALAVANYEAAESEHHRAETNFRLAREAVDSYITRVAQDPRLREHDLEALRKQLLGEALSYYHKFVNESGDQPGVEAERGRAYARLAFITQEIGTKQEAIDLYEKSLAVFEQLAHDHPDVLDYRSEIAFTSNALGNLYRLTDPRNRAEDCYLRARDLREQLASAEPCVVRDNDLAASQMNLGNYYRIVGRTDAAEEALLSAIEIEERLADESPVVLIYRHTLALANNDLGILYATSDRLDDARRAFEKAVEVEGRLREENPSVPDYQFELARSHNNLGNVCRFEDDLDEAERHYRAALEVRERLAREHPSVVAYQSDVAVSHQSLGDLELLAERPEEAREELQKALDAETKLVREHPGVLEYVHNLGLAQQSLGQLALSGGRLDEAEAAFRSALEIQNRLAKEHPESREYRQNLAETYENVARLYEFTQRAAEAEAAHQKAQELQATR
jgi:tetratricopeptide (TPR) repeat protein/tRNA A-37 threonylcarbamoyl transferase component Bud32